MIAGGWALSAGATGARPTWKRCCRRAPTGRRRAKLELFLAQLSTGGYTHLWMMQDTFLLSTGNFPERLREVCRKKNIHSTLYFPVDAPLDPAWTDIIAAVDCPIAYTAYGEGGGRGEGATARA